MKVSYDWLKSMVELPEDPSELSREFIRTGTEVEAIETVGESFDHIVTAKVLSKEAHPDSDHLWVTMVEVGANNVDAEGNPEPLQIVCGAQNFNEGDHIVTAMIGADLRGDIHIKKGKLRGVVSMGMTAARGAPSASIPVGSRSWVAAWSTPTSCATAASIPRAIPASPSAPASSASRRSARTCPTSARS